MPQITNSDKNLPTFLFSKEKVFKQELIYTSGILHWAFSYDPYEDANTSYVLKQGIDSFQNIFSTHLHKKYRFVKFSRHNDYSKNHCTLRGAFVDKQKNISPGITILRTKCSFFIEETIFLANRAWPTMVEKSPTAVVNKTHQPLRSPKHQPLNMVK